MFKSKFPELIIGGGAPHLKHSRAHHYDSRKPIDVPIYHNVPLFFLLVVLNFICPVLEPVQNEVGTIANFLIRRAINSVKLAK